MISLIVATLNRVTELERLLVSLDEQTYKDFEVIVVDQNPDDRLVATLCRHGNFPIHHLHSARGLSRARNVGLPHAKGDIIAFPDDDCWYPPQLLACVRELFEAHPEFGVLFAILRDADNQPVGPKWPDHSCLWSKGNVWECGISPTAFLRRAVTDAIGLFNEKIGLGAATPYQSGEDVDYFVRPLKLGFKMWYDPALTVRHPSFHSLDRLRQRSYSYALGGGYTLRAHGYPLRRLLKSLVRSVGGCVVNLFRGNFLVAHSYLLRAAGLTRGYLLGPSDLGKVRLPAD
jgi:glycosyltransferase involved in cell wall biosynthesis